MDNNKCESSPGETITENSKHILQDKNKDTVDKCENLTEETMSATPENVENVICDKTNEDVRNGKSKDTVDKCEPSTTETIAVIPENGETVINDKFNKNVIHKKSKDPVRKFPPKKNQPGFHLEMFKETSYYFKGGLRYVYPYRFTFTAYVKKRWLNLTVLDLFSKEFHMETMEYYKKAIKEGRIKVNYQPVSAEQVLLNNDVLQTMVHRHEPPVIHETIEFLQNDNEMVVINKPPSIPVHPCGRYRHNTIVFILGKEYDLHGLHTIHRIDRLTSGVLMFARTIQKAKEFENQLHQKRNVEKEYLARVVGKFPDEEIVVDKSILTASHRIGVCHVHEDGKTCSTKFKRLSFNGTSSVVSCIPHTGRMHQIRVHLQWLGYPIVNDPIYNHPTAWGERKRKCDIEQVILELLRTRKDKSYDDDLKTDKCGSNSSEVKITDCKTNDDGSCKKRKIEVSVDDKYEIDNTVDDNVANEITENVTDDGTACNSTIGNIKDEGILLNPIISCDDTRVSYTSRDIGEEYVDKDCTDCKRTWKEPLLSEMVMYLHSLHYKGPDWEYKTSTPKWAEADWYDD